MKKNIKTGLAVLLSVIMILSFSACAKTDAPDSLWDDAKYTENTELGEGSKQFEFQVKVNDNSVTFTVNTDKEILGDALLENDLVSGDEGAYGLYVKTVNGIYADFDENGYYWSFSKNGEMMMTGVDGEKIEQGAHYEMTYTK